MKILNKNILLTAAAVCLSCMLSTTVSAKVCFVGDESCGSGSSFNDYEDQGENACLGVVDENGKQIYQKGPCGNGMQVTAYCPYDSSYVQCCGKEYIYNTPCVYPLVSKGKCGNKYKCECDAATYKYTDSECKTVKGSAGDGYENSYASGASCTQMRYDSGSGEVVSEVKYTSCQCDRGLYPKLGFIVPKPDPFQSDCDNNAEKEGPCSTKYADSNRTETYYKFCRCNTSDYSKTDAGCYPLTGDASKGSCFDTIMHYEQCATCDGFPARNLEHVAYPGQQPKRCERDQEGNLVDVSCNYEVCPHDQSGNSYFKIWRCDEPGYEVNSTGSACVKISCSKAVTQFIAENKNYGLFDGKYLRDANGTITSARYGIVADSVTLTSSKSCGTPVTQYKTVCTSAKCVSSFAEPCMSYVENQTGLVCGSGGAQIMSNSIEPNAIRPPVGATTFFCCTRTRKVSLGTTYPDQGALGCTNITSYYSPQYVVYNNGATSSDGARAMNVACETAPKITSSSALNGTSSRVYTYGIDWHISGNMEKPLEIRNGKVYFSGASVKADLKLYRESGRPNVVNTLVEGNNYVYSTYTSDGYDYNMSTFQVDNKINENPVLIRQGTKTERIDFKATNLKVKGQMAFYNANIDVNNGYIGVFSSSEGGQSTSNGHRQGSSVMLYRSKYNLYNNSKRYVYMANDCFLGNINKNYGSEISVQYDGSQKNAFRIAHKAYQHWGDAGGCDRRNHYIIDQYGSIKSVTRCADGSNTNRTQKCDVKNTNTGICKFSSTGDHELTNYQYGSRDAKWERDGCTACKNAQGLQVGYDQVPLWTYDF